MPDRVRDRLAGVVLPPVVRLWMSTLRVRWAGWEGTSLDSAGREPVIWAFWHQRLLLPAYTHRDRGTTVMVSRHGDGELIARVLEGLGSRTVRGSTTRGGAMAMRGMLRAARDGRDLCVTPDGPRGPRHRVQPGVVHLASRTGIPVVPMTAAFARARRLSSWDAFVVPRPWTRAVLRLGPALSVPADLGAGETDDYVTELERRLIALTDETDSNFEHWWRAGARGPEGRGDRPPRLG